MNAVLQAVIPSAQVLVRAAMRACDRWGDDQPARQAMRDACLETPPHQRADLIKHFEETYP